VGRIKPTGVSGRLGGENLRYSPEGLTGTKPAAEHCLILHFPAHPSRYETLALLKAYPVMVARHENTRTPQTTDRSVSEFSELSAFSTSQSSIYREVQNS
jgi:hypothetical protein